MQNIKSKTFLKLYLVLGLLAFISSFLGNNWFKKYGETDCREKKSVSIQNKLHVNSEEINIALSSFLKNGKIQAKSVEGLKAKGIDLFVYKNLNPIFWTSNAYNISPNYYQKPTIIKHLRDYILVESFKIKETEYIFTQTIINNPDKFLGSNSNSNSLDCIFDLTKDIGTLKINIKNDTYYLQTSNYYPPNFFDFLFLLGFIVFCISIYTFFKRYQKTSLGFVLVIACCVILDIAFYKGLCLNSFKIYQIFSPELFASNLIAPNLGVLFYRVFIFFLISLYLNYFHHNTKVKITTNQKIFLQILSLILFTWFTNFANVYTSKIVTDSSLSFDFYELYLFNRYTILALIVIFMNYLTVYNLYSYCKEFESNISKNKWNKYIPLIVFIVFFVYFWLSFNYLVAVVSLGILLFISYYRLFLGKVKNYFLLLKILIPCVASSILFNYYMSKKDLQHRNTIATNVLLQNENETNSKFSTIEQKFNGDLSILDYFTCEDETKQEFVARIKELYLTSFSDEFDIQIISFDAKNINYREQNPYTYKEMDTIYSKENNNNISKNFNIITEKKLKGSYIGKFIIMDSFKKLGTLYVLMKPLELTSEGKISDILEKKSLSDIFNTFQYSFAIYSKGNLSRHVGSYSYALTSNLTKKSNYNENGFNHVVYTDALNNSIIVSEKHKTWVQILSAFTLIFISTIIFFICYYLLLLVKHYFDYWKNKTTSKMRFLSFIYDRYNIPFWDRISLGQKLQVYIIGTVFLTFCIILLVTVGNITDSSKQQQKELLQLKTAQIVNTISSQANIKSVFFGNKNNLLYDLSKFYNTDINLYDTSGKLTFTSNDKIYQKDLIGKLMRPEVFLKLNGGKRISAVTDEKLGSLNYISSYQGLFDNNLSLVGYLNLPYFGNEQELLQEISSYGATLINIFALVFAFAAIISYYFGQLITKPLNIIRNKLGNTKLGNTIKPIQYNSNDEIGQLVLEYNKMLTKLEDSKNKLAQSEREGAWKEMAKQVAHEIKNPLTPMKLSLQHLQLSISRDNAIDIIPKVNKVSELLINQIDSLSRMAEEFSSFAKMPEAKLEKVYVNNLLENCVELFNKEEYVSIHTSLTKSKTAIHVDSQQFNRVITNLLKNALQAIPENKIGIIEVGMQLFKNKVHIWVKDNGKGIPEELFSRIFSPNFSTKNSGMGLGLAMSKKIIEQFNGSITFKSEVNIGSIFTIEIPIYKD